MRNNSGLTVTLDWDQADALVVSVLSKVLERYIEHPDRAEPEYGEQIKAALAFVIEHFGGEPPVDPPTVDLPATDTSGRPF